jgi:hypothetical protein
VKKYKYHLCKFFKNLIYEAWDSKSVVKAHGFLVFLEDFESVFLLAVFSDAFSYADLLFHLLPFKDFDILYCEMKIKGTQAHFCCDKDRSSPSIRAHCVSQKNPAEQRKMTSQRRGI